MLPNKIPIFPLSNFIIFPETSVPLNIFEPRYIKMIDDSMQNNRIIGMVQPKSKSNNSTPELHKVGCIGKITNFNETNDGRYLIVLKGISRFTITEEIKNEKPYRECNVNFDNFKSDTCLEKRENIKLSDLKIIFKNLSKLFEKKGYLIDLKEFEKQTLDQTINGFAMASPFSLEEKQVLLETKNLDNRKSKLEEILKTYLVDNFNNTTLQ